MPSHADKNRLSGEKAVSNAATHRREVLFRPTLFRKADPEQAQSNGQADEGLREGVWSGQQRGGFEDVAGGEGRSAGLRQGGSRIFIEGRLPDDLSVVVDGPVFVHRFEDPLEGKAEQESRGHPVAVEPADTAVSSPSVRIDPAGTLHAPVRAGQTETQETVLRLLFFVPFPVEAQSLPGRLAEKILAHRVDRLEMNRFHKLFDSLTIIMSSINFENREAGAPRR
jgi:hypothetical protein